MREDGPEELVLVKTPDLTAEEWEYEDDALPDHNPTCPPHEDVVICIEKEVLDDYLPAGISAGRTSPFTS